MSQVDEQGEDALAEAKLALVRRGRTTRTSPGRDVGVPRRRRAEGHTVGGDERCRGGGASTDFAELVLRRDACVRRLASSPRRFVGMAERRMP